MGVVIANCLMAFLAASVAVVPPAPMATEVLAIAVTDKPVAKAQSPVAVTRMVPASAAAVGQVPERCLTPRGHSPTTVPREMAQCLAREGQEQSAKEVQQRSQLDHSRNLSCFPCLPESPAHSYHSGGSS